MLHSSSKHDWRTPAPLFEHFDRLCGGFDLDAAADAESKLCPVWLGPGSTLGEDALSIDWYEAARLALGIHRGSALRVWLNPPYGDALLPFLTMAAGLVTKHPALDLWCLVPARVDTAWWEVANTKAIATYFLRGRVPFEGTVLRKLGHEAAEDATACAHCGFPMEYDEPGYKCRERAPVLVTVRESAPFPSAVIRMGADGHGSPAIHWRYVWRPVRQRSRKRKAA